MIVHNITLRGFKGIKHGMGLDEIAIDFDGLEGLIALAGDNGLGKTTVLENMHPYRTMKSRAGALHHQCFLKDSRKILEFTMDGNRYRSDIRINAMTGKQEAFLYVNGNDESEITGKLKEYDAAITEMLGSEALFFSSIFCAQNSAKLTDLKPAELKQLFTEFLRLDVIAGYEDTAKKVLAKLDTRLQTARGAVDMLRVQFEGLDDAQQAKTELEIELAAVEKELSDKASAPAEVRAQIQDAIEKRAARSADTELIKSVREQMDSAGRKHAADSKRVNDEIDAAEQKIKGLWEKLEADRERLELATKADGLRKDADEIEAKITAKRNEIDFLTEQHHDLTAAIEKKRDLLAQLREAREKTISTTDKEVHTIELNIQTINGKVDGKKVRIRELDSDPEAARIAQSLDSLEQSLSDLDRKDPACVSTTCSYIVRALEAQKEIPTLRKALEDRLSQNRGLINGILAEIKALNQDAEREYSKIDRMIHDTADVVKATEVEIKIVEESMSTVVDDRERVTTRLTEVRDAIDLLFKGLERTNQLLEGMPNVEAVQASVDALTASYNEACNAKDHMDSELDELQAAWRTVESGYLGQLSELTKRIEPELEEDSVERLTRILDVVEKDISRLKTERATMQERIRSCEKALKERELLNAKIENANALVKKARSDIYDWEYVRKACGKDGIRALEVDAVAPTIAYHANELLHRTFGPAFSVKFITTDPETGKEVLKIVAIREDGSEDEAANLSGGERVWILKACRLAQTLISKEKTGRNVETALADEEDGPLSESKAMDFIRMHQAFKSLGGFRKVFFISHKPPVVAMADSQVNFTPTGITVD